MIARRVDETTVRTISAAAMIFEWMARKPQENPGSKLLTWLAGLVGKGHPA